MARKLAVRVGQVFGRLTVAGESVDRRGQPCYRCVCECGGSVSVPYDRLNSGKTRSCGCLRPEVLHKHGAARDGNKDVEYQCWQDMKNRCYNSKNRVFEHYGGRGVAVCVRWLNSFENFLADMGRRPGKGWSIERIDNEGPYSPENCRWADRFDQSRNQRRTNLVTVEGVTLCLSDWSKLTGVAENTLRHRIYKLGINPKEAMDPNLRLWRGARKVGAAKPPEEATSLGSE